MPKTELIKNSFVGGEISPRVLSRTDLAKYHSACESIQNFIVQAQGGVVRRPGTQYVCDAGGPNRLIPFQVSPTQQYVIEMGQNYFRFYTNSGQILTPSGTAAYEIATPYNLVDMWGIHYAQQISTMYLTHPNYPPQKLIRLSDTNWLMTSPSFYAPPCFQNDQDVGTNKNASITIGPTGIATASHPVFILGDIGKALVAGSGIGYITGPLLGPTATDSVTGATLYTGASLNVVDAFDTTFYNVGNWFLRGGPNAYFSPGQYINSTNHEWIAAHVLGPGSAVSVYSTTDHPTDKSYQTVSGTTYVNVTYTAGFTDCFRVIDQGMYVPFSGGYARIATVISSTQINIVIIAVPTITEVDAYGNPIIAPAPPGTWYYETPAFTSGNYPHGVGFLGDRLYFAGTLGETPNTIWGSNVGDYENFALGDLDSSGIRETLNSGSFDHIHWLATYQGNLIAGGVNKEYILNGGAGQQVVSAGAPITPKNFNAITQSAYGVAPVQGIQVDDDFIYIQKTALRTYQFAFNLVTSSYGSKNLNILNELITTSGFKEMVYQLQPNKVLWFTDNSNQLVGLTYDKEQDIWAWHRHFTGVDTSDAVVSIANITQNEGVTEQLWMLCKRTRGGRIVYTMEFANDALAMDCSLQRQFTSPVTQLTLLQYLSGRPVTVTADGWVLPTIMMDDTGIYHFPAGFSGRSVQVGINFNSQLVTVRPEPRATIQGLKKRWLRIWARLYNTLGLTINGQIISFRSPQNPIGVPVPVFTGDVQINNLGFDPDGRITIQQPQPLNTHILAVFGIFEFSEGV